MNAVTINRQSQCGNLNTPFSTSLEHRIHGEPAAGPNTKLAADVLSQAASDLRRFHTATTGLKHELYRDAYDWLTTNDSSWPFSFLNVCQALDLVPEMVRDELFADISLGWFGYWVNRNGRVCHYLRFSFVCAFSRNPDAYTGEIGFPGFEIRPYENAA